VGTFGTTNFIRPTASWADQGVRKTYLVSFELLYFIGAGSKYTPVRMNATSNTAVGTSRSSPSTGPPTIRCSGQRVASTGKLVHWLRFARCSAGVHASWTMELATT
jgi:hypothetical protein